MSQTPCIKVAAGAIIPDPSSTTRTGGDVVVVGTIPLICLPTDPNYAGHNALDSESLWDVPKDTSTFSAGDAVYWAAAGSPVLGTASSGAATSTASGNTLMGFATIDAVTGDNYVRTKLSAAKRTATIAGSVTADDITGSDSSLGIAGISTTTGGAVAISGGTSSTSGTAGGAASLTGGTPGATGVGGAASVAGGIGGSTSGAGGAVTIAGGAGTLNANGGALTLNGGAKNGSGTDGAIAIGTSNTVSVTLGKMPRIPTATVAAAGTVQGDAAAIVEGFTLVTGSTNAGVKLPSAVAGMQVIIKNNVGGNMKVWPNTSDAINAITADAAFTMATLTSCLFVAYDATTWYTIPLVAS